MASTTPPSDAARNAKPAPSGPRYVYPEALTDKDLEDMDTVLPVDGEAFLKWLAGEGPEPEGWRDGST
jgi:hypothetical protein